jgi:hypothetical protein
MVSRILQLLVVDILTVGVALRRPAAGPTPSGVDAAGIPVPTGMAPQAGGEAPDSGADTSTTTALARMTLHSR